MESPLSASPTEGEHQVQTRRRRRWPVDDRGWRIDVDLVAVPDTTAIMPVMVAVIPIAIVPFATVLPPVVTTVVIMIGKRRCSRGQQ